MKKALSILICMLLLVSLLSGCSKEVTVDTTGLVHMTFDGAATAMTKEGFTATLVAEEHYDLPETINVVMEGQEGAASFTYDPATGKVEIAEVVGAITITGEATESIVGTWKGSVDFSEVMTKTMTAADESMANYFTFPNLTLDLIMTFTADGTCTLSGDPASVEALADALGDCLMDGMVLMIEDLLKEQGLDITFEQYLTLAGITREQLQAQMMSQFDTDELLSNLENEGNYLVEDGVLYISENLNTEIDKEDGSAFTLENGVLTIQASELDADNEFVQMLFPLVLNRAD